MRACDYSLKRVCSSQKRLAIDTTVKDSWIAKVGMVLVVLLVGWNVYSGVHLHKVGIPPFALEFDSSTGPSALTGTWKYEMLSDLSHQPLTGYMDLTADGDVITGEMDNPDQLNKNERSAVKGQYINKTLTLTRNTNHDGVMQEYRLFPKDNGFSGTFKNLGQEGYYKDSGAFRIHR